MNEEAIVGKAHDLGLQYEKKYRGCAQCAVAAIQDVLGIREDSVYKCASGLAAGVGACTDGSCGAYAGGVLMMSYLFGRSRQDEATQKGAEDKQVSSRMAAELHDLFVAEYGSVQCRDIHKELFGRTFDLRSTEDKAAFDEAGAHTDDGKCGAVVGRGAGWAVALIREEMRKRGENAS